MIPDDRKARMTPDNRKAHMTADDRRLEDDEVRRRQRGRAVVTAVLLALFVILVYAITIAKMTVNR